MELSFDSDNLIEYCPESPPSNSIEHKIIYVCSLCLRQYDLTEDLRGHLIEYHKYKPIVQGKVTQNGIAAEQQQQKHKNHIKLTSHTDETDLEKCDAITPVYAEMRPMPFKDFRIILRAHMQLRCTVFTKCAYKFANTTKLALHVKCHKNNGELFSCNECGLEMQNWRRCSAHLWKVHQTDVDLLHCPICEFKSHASALVWRHMRLHKKWRPRVLRSLRAVQRRREQNQQKTPAKKEAQMPAPTTSNKNKYYAEKSCEICNRKFVNGKTLSKHVKTVHNKIKPFICNVCGKKTARKASLIIHMRQHTGEKPLQCTKCKFSTRDPSVLHKHQMRHDKVGKFKCAHCNYTCIQTNAYKRHIRLNHVEEYRKIACDLCNYCTISEQKLEAHKEDHRKGLIVNCEDSMDATRSAGFKYPRKLNDKNHEISADCFLPLESIDSLPHEPTVDTGGVTIPAPSEDTQFPTYLNN